jgi:hypothetical protein
MRKPAVLLLILALAVSTIAPFLPVKANPNMYPFPPDVPAPESVHIIIKMESPTWNTVYENGTINAIFNVTVEGPSSFNGKVLNKNLMLTTYQGDWMQESAWCPSRIFRTLQFYPYNFSITGIPFGEHYLNFTSHAQGNLVLENGSGRGFTLERTILVKFSVRADPIITFASLQNATFENASVPLNFTVDHSVTEMSYCLDGQEAIPMSGNTTLTDLANGQHNVTVCATDEFGYTGVSDMLFFNVNVTKVDASEFPVLPFIAVSAVVVVSAATGVMVYFKKRKR